MAGSTPSAGAETGFAFVHGAGLRTWVWAELTPLLDAPTLAAPYPARDAGQSVRDDLRLGDHVDHVAGQLLEWDVPQMVVVAHSIGGAVALDVVDRLPDRVVGFVGLAAAVPRRGESFLSCLPLRQRLPQRALMRVLGTKPPDAVVRRSLCDGLSEAHTERVVTEFVPESRRLYTDAVESGIPDVPARYVETTDDESFPPARQDRMVENLGTRDVVTVDAGHMAMLSHPAEVATALEEFDREEAR